MLVSGCVIRDLNVSVLHPHKTNMALEDRHLERIFLIGNPSIWGVHVSFRRCSWDPRYVILLMMIAIEVAKAVVWRIYSVSHEKDQEMGELGSVLPPLQKPYDRNPVINQG